MEDIAELFLVNFTQSLIQTKNPINQVSSPQNISKEESKEVMQESVLKINEAKPKEPEQLKQIDQKVIQKINQDKAIKIKKIQSNQQSIQEQISSKEKLSRLLKDPFVSEIECLGANTPLMVRKSGMQQKTQVGLPIEDIYEIIAEFSQKTRIPIINGKIKTAFNNLIMTAVLSETLGPRFIIQKIR